MARNSGHRRSGFRKNPANFGRGDGAGRRAVIARGGARLRLIVAPRAPKAWLETDWSPEGKIGDTSPARSRTMDRCGVCNRLGRARPCRGTVCPFHHPMGGQLAQSLAEGARAGAISNSLVRWRDGWGGAPAAPYSRKSPWAESLNRSDSPSLFGRKAGRASRGRWKGNVLRRPHDCPLTFADQAVPQGANAALQLDQQGISVGGAFFPCPWPGRAPAHFPSFHPRPSHGPITARSMAPDGPAVTNVALRRMADRA